MFLQASDLIEAARTLAGQPVATTAEMGPGWFNDRQAWYTLLLRQTLEYAERTVPFYRRRAAETGARAAAFDRISDLGRFPILRKAEIVDHFREFLSDDARPDHFYCTSGTTARRLTIYGNDDEARAMDSLLQIRAPVSGGERRISFRILPNCLRVFAPPARSHSSVYNVVVNFSLSQTHHQWFDNSDHLIQILNDEYFLGGRESKRISMIHATPPYLIEFITTQCLMRGIVPSDFGIELIAASGGFTTPRQRRMIEETWGAECVTSYSCSEINGESLEFAGQPGVYMSGPSVFHEIVDPDTFEPVGDGEVGAVVSSSLHPFQAVMPFIRYFTGDLAQRLPLPGFEGRPPFLVQPIGRIQHCARVGARAFVGTLDALDAVAAFDGIPQMPYPRHRLSVQERPGGRRAVLLEVEANGVSGAARERLQSSIASALGDRVAERTGVALDPDLAFECKVVGKGELEGYPRLYPDR